MSLQRNQEQHTASNLLAESTVAAYCTAGEPKHAPELVCGWPKFAGTLPVGAFPAQREDCSAEVRWQWLPLVGSFAGRREVALFHLDDNADNELSSPAVAIGRVYEE